LQKKITLILVLCVVFLDEMGLGLVYPMFSSMVFQSNGLMANIGASQLIKGLFLGMLYAAPAISAFISGPILGAASDQKGRKPLYIFSLSLAVFGYMACIVSVILKNIWMLIFSRAIVGIAVGNAGVVGATVADLSTKDNKVKNFGLYSMASGVGFMTGPFLGGIFAKNSFVVPFIMATILTLLNLLLIVFFLKETFPGKIKNKIRYLESFYNVKKAFQQTQLRTIFAAAIVFCFAWSFFYEFIPVSWIEHGFTVKQVALFYAYGAGIYALSSGVLIRPFVKYNNYAVVFYSIAALGLSMVGCLYMQDRFYIWVYMAILNFLIALAYPTYSAMVSNSVDENMQGEIMGMLQSVQMLAFGISPILGGMFLGVSTNTPMIIGGGAMLLSACILAIFLPKVVFKMQ